MNKVAHCGPCTPMKMEAIRMISDILFEDKDALDIKTLCLLAEDSVPEDLGPFIHDLEQAVVHLEKNEKYKDKAKKLRQIHLQLMDTQEKIDRDEIDVVGQRKRAFDSSDAAEAHEEAKKAYKYLKSLIPDLEPEQAIRSADPRAKDPTYLDQYKRWKAALPMAKLYGRLSKKEAATYDTWETDREWTRLFQDRGLNPSVYPHRDYPEDSRTFPREQTRPRHQQEHWRKKKEQEDKAEVGGEGMVPGAAPGSTYWKQSPSLFNAMPMGNTISLTIEFMAEGLKAICTWDPGDLPEGLDEQQTLLRLIEFLELNIPEAMKKFKSITVDDVDLTNRTVTLMVGK